MISGAENAYAISKFFLGYGGNNCFYLNATLCQ
jgi:hypothetical protein